MASQDWFDKDFYAILGVSKTVSESELKKVYRKLARDFHPDSNPGDAKAESRFKEISEAYTVLSDPQSRREYDQIKAMGSGARFTANGAGPGGFEDVFSNLFGGGQRANFPQGDDLFSGLFGSAGTSGFGGQGRARAQKGADLTAHITIDFRTAVKGGEVSISTSRGSKPINISIPAGVNDQQKIRVRGKGEVSMTGGAQGDLVLTVTVTPHPIFAREGDNLRIDLPVSVPEAVLGATVEVPTIEGERVKVKVPANTPSGRVLRVRGHGVSVKGKKGDLLVNIQIVTPDLLPDSVKKLAEEWKKVTEGEDPRGFFYSKANL